ncbi:MAG: UDP-N-acetylmuramate:L-alanyl-gamma-D-glutamyl-meso-diaminopimelate ligase [Betaproteobacteria bacterium]|nr:UDP-N-acetylmuramate:L-alanyl-gamma-D-glutamyl-meso-diaminopimelate ligase [Betaproteobacteria bacterium]
MHIHILGICGTFMGGIAVIAKEAGHHVTGCDANVYPPMSTQLKEQGIHLIEGFAAEQINLKPDLFVIGNVVSRGNPLMEAILDHDLNYVSGPQWLSEHILKHCRTLAVAGTHGKTTTSSMAAFILDQAGYQPGFLIGGVAHNLKVSARLPKHFNHSQEKPWFVIEADEYDTAFFDKRSKFIHYHPEVAILNNLEFDHADIFKDIEAIKTQFHHLIRTIPAKGTVVYNEKDDNLQDVIDQGVWSHLAPFQEGGPYQLSVNNAQMTLNHQHSQLTRTFSWQLLGAHNEANAKAVVTALSVVGLDIDSISRGLEGFTGIARRMEVRGIVNDITVYDDFAHHPTAIATTIQGLREKIHHQRILAVIEPRSNTMKQGVWADTLAQSLSEADHVFAYSANIGWDIDSALQSLSNKLTILDDLDQLVSAICKEAKPGDHVLVMSNGGFGGIHERLLSALQQ